MFSSMSVTCTGMQLVVGLCDSRLYVSVIVLELSLGYTSFEIVCEEFVSVVSVVMFKYPSSVLESMIVAGL